METSFFRFLFIVIGVSVVSTGCRTDYLAAAAARHDAMYGDGSGARRYAAELESSRKNHVLGAMERSRIDQLAGDFAGSSARMKPELERLFDDTLEGPRIKKGEVAGQLLAATVADDTAIPYALPAYEMLFALNYEYLNALCSGDTGNAAVYLRRATFAQQQLKDENSSSDAAKETEKNENKAAEEKAIAGVNNEISAIADTVRASYENALSWYLAGLNWEHEGDPSNAEIAYREAAAIAPSTAKLPRSGSPTDVLVVFEEGVVDQRVPIKIPLPIGGTVVSCDFPVYRGGPYCPASLTAGYGASSAELVKAVDVQALAYRDLKDRIPGMVTRNITRTAVKIAAQQAVNHIDTGNACGDLALQLGVLGYNIFHTVVSEADTRSWLTLPECVRLARFPRDPAAKVVTIRNAAGGVIEAPIPENAKGPVIVWVTDFCGFATATSVALGGGRVEFLRTGSLVGAGDGRFLYNPNNR